MADGKAQKFDGLGFFLGMVTERDRNRYECWTGNPSKKMMRLPGLIDTFEVSHQRIIFSRSAARDAVARISCG